MPIRSKLFNYFLKLGLYFILSLPYKEFYQTIMLLFEFIILLFISKFLGFD